jgi:hypothetical protein
MGRLKPTYPSTKSDINDDYQVLLSARFASDGGLNGTIDFSCRLGYAVTTKWLRCGGGRR